MWVVQHRVERKHQRAVRAVDIQVGRPAEDRLLGDRRITSQQPTECREVPFKVRRLGGAQCDALHDAAGEKGGVGMVEGHWLPEPLLEFS